MKNLITLKSSESNISIAEKFVDIICTNYGISEELYGNILISVTEAVNNAIVHGNNNNPNKNVRIESDFVDNFLKISISDEGEGFDFTNIPDPTAQENIEKINALAENYPDLKASENYKTLQKAIADVEEHLQASRRLYNANVSSYNQKIVTFPSSVIASSKGLTKKEFFLAEEKKREDVKIDL